MATRFVATMLARTEENKTGSLAVTVTDAAGRKRTLTITPELALALADVFSSFGAKSVHPELEAMKRPLTYAIGSGKYENVVLLRFEDEAAYALPARSALELAKALLEQSEAIALRPVTLLQ